MLQAEIGSETEAFTFWLNERSPPRRVKVFKRGAPPSWKLFSLHHWSSAPPSPRAPPRRPMPPNLNSIECESGFRWNADGGGILQTPCFDKESVHCFLCPVLRKVTTDKEICGCFQPSGRMTNKQTSLSSKKCTTWKGALLHDLLHHLSAASVLLCWCWCRLKSPR